MTSQSTDATPARPATTVRQVAEVLDAGDIPLWRHPEWAERFPWLTQGTTGAGGQHPGALDFGLFGGSPVGAAVDRWRRLRETTGFPTAVHSRQVHGARVATWGEGLPPGLIVTEGMDAHVISAPGVLATVSVADCVPVFLVHESARAAAVVHAGWRGVAAGVFEAGLGDLSPAGADPEDVWVHCGPSICGACYEVGPEVHEAVRPGIEPPAEKRPIDLAAAVVERAAAAGVRSSRITVSSHCTRCGEGCFFSHRGGSTGRQMGVIGLRP